MKDVVNNCVDCELPCISSCPYWKTKVYYCDSCGKEGAEYRIDGDDYCEDCAEKYLHDVFDDLSLMDKGDALNIDIKENF